MILRSLAIVGFLLSSLVAIAQNGTVTGTVTDTKNKETLVGVNVYITEENGTTTDLDGKFTLSVPAGNHTLTISYLGYKSQEREIRVKSGETTTINIPLLPAAEELNIVVVSGSKREKSIAEESVSIEVVDNELIENTNSVNLAEAVDKVAGVNIFDGQITIRGGSGYAFGAGSRVQLIIDGLPLLSVDRSEIRWNFIPLEITEQVEVIKSASSALYGASALNGVVNINTAWAGDKPETEAALYYNMYAAPRDKTQAWWKQTQTDPVRYGGWFSHKQRFGRLDLVVSGSYNKSIGYIRLLDTGYRRLSVKLRHRPKKIEGLSYGLMVNMMDSEESDYFFWKDNGEGIYVPFGSDGQNDKGTLSQQRRRTVMVDPFVTYFDKYSNKHSLKLRYNHISLQFTSTGPKASLLMGEYQFQRKWPLGFTTTAGVQGQKYILDDKDLGERTGSNIAAFAQVDHKWRRLNSYLGFRYERFSLDGTYTNGRPVFSAGVNYQAGKATYLRASFGQGFRFPSIAERFVDESLEGINIFPNPDLKPEYGFNGELGLKQGIKIGEFLAYWDLSFFWMEYWDMTEFALSFYPGEGVGFKAVNVSRARVAGFETSIMAQGTLGKTPIRWQGGYTYNYAVDLGSNPELNNVGTYLEQFFKSIPSNSEETLAPMLNYRSRHLVKSDIEVDVWKLTFGLDTRYYGFVEKLDAIFIAYIDGLEEYREEHDKGSFLMNVRAAINTGKFGKVSFIVNNALNSSISVRPARMQAPLNFVLQYKITI